MRYFENIEVGAATHTGRVRSTNEDDYLIYVPQDPGTLQQSGCLFVVADGMGGVTGGAEASRAAVRALAQSFIGNGEPGAAESQNGALADRMRSGFAAATQQVLELSRESPSLRDMGTTLTAASLRGSRLVLGHVGDTRCLLLRDGEIAQLTEDHAVRSPDNYLTRCVGAGQQSVDADVGNHRLQVGDRILLLTDGLWSVIDDQEIARIARVMEPQLAAAELVRQANRAGGPDNSTVIIVHLRSVGPDPGPLHESDIPAEEVRQPSNLRPPDESLVAPRWPWFLLVASLALLVVALLKMLYGIDLIGDLARYLGL